MQSPTAKKTPKLVLARESLRLLTAEDLRLALGESGPSVWTLR